MKEMYYISGLILFAFIPQRMVIASDHSLESSADSYIRPMRMDPSNQAPPGSSLSHQLPPFLAYNLRTMSMEAPTIVTITRNENIIGSGYAIHPYLILTRSVYVRSQYAFGVMTRDRNGEGHIPHRIRQSRADPTGEFVIIQLMKPIFLDEPVHGAFHAAKYPVSATNWAYHEAMEWIPRLMTALRPILRQNLNEANLVNPAKVQIYCSERPSPASGYAVHPYIVVTRPEFVTRNSSVVSSTASRGDPRTHRIQSSYSNRALNVERIQLLDPILLRTGETGALTAEHYSAQAIEWARTKVEEWKHSKLNQRNYHEENAA